MNEQLVTNLDSFGVSPWEIEVIYGILNERFLVKQKEITQVDSDFVSILNITIPLSFNDEFFKWFEFKRWGKIKSILKEMKRRRGRNHALKINLSFTGEPKIKFIVDAKDGDWFNNAVEKIDFVLELIPYHLDPEKLPEKVSEIIYKYDPNAARWRLNTAIVNEKMFSFSENGWKIIT